jgi:hypothetical protein
MNETKTKINKVERAPKGGPAASVLLGARPYDLASEEKRVRKLVKQAIKATGTSYRGEINQLLAGLTLPRDYQVPRLPNGSDPTGAAHPWAKYDVAYPSNIAVDPQAFNESPSFLFRDALRNFVHIVYMGAQAAYTGAMTFTTTGNMDNFPTYPTQGGGLLTVSTDTPHGKVLYPGRVGPADQHRGWLANTNDAIQLAIDTTPYAAGQTLYAHIKQLQNGTWKNIGQLPFAGSTGTVTQTYYVGKTGYYAITFTYSNNTMIANTANLVLYVGTTGQTVWGQKSLPNFDVNYNFIDALRVVGVSLMYTNTASPLNQQGQIVGLQVPKGSSWLQWASFGTNSVDQKSRILKAANGMYGFLKPTSRDDLDMIVYELPDQANVQNAGNECVFNLYPSSDFLCVIPQVNIVAGQTGYWTIGTSVEYTTMNQWIELHTSAITNAELDSVFDVLGPIEQWHTNGLHWDEIWGEIKSVARDVFNGIKEIAPIALAAAPLLL